MSLVYYFVAQLNKSNIPNLPDNNPNASFISDTILPLVFGLLGGLSVLFVVIGGLKYVTSAGNPENAKKARETILYSLIGLVVSLMAFTITTFVIDNVSPSDSGTGALLGPEGIITRVTQLMVYAIGLIAALMIIVGAIRFIISGGDPNATKTARDTILYSLIGLVVAIAAQGIVTFVLEAF